MAILLPLDDDLPGRIEAIVSGKETPWVSGAAGLG